MAKKKPSAKTARAGGKTRSEEAVNGDRADGVQQCQKQPQPESAGDQPSPPPPPPQSMSLVQRHAGMMLTIVVWSVYVRTAYTYVSGGDTGELMITSCQWGVGHPPGYPLYTMLGIVFQHIIPFGSMAWRVNMGTSTLGAGAVWFVYQTAVRLSGGSVIAGVVAGGCYGLSPLVWLYAHQGEVFALNNLLCAIMVYLTVRHFDRPPTRTHASPQEMKWAYAGAFVCGLAATNQHTTIFFIVPTVCGVLVDLAYQGTLTARRFTTLACCGLLGVLPYAYMPLAAHLQSLDSWGDQRTVTGFLHHFLRREYGTFQLAANETSNDPGTIVRLQYYFSELLRESLYLGPALALVGVASISWSSRRRWTTTAAAVVLVVDYVLYVWVFHYLANMDPQQPLLLGVQARFWQQPNMLVFVWMGVGFEWALSRLINLLTTTTTTSSSSSSSSGGVDGGAHWLRRVGLVIAVAMVLVQGGMHYKTRDNSATMCFQASGESMLRSFPDNSLVMVNGDLFNNVLKYPFGCERVRPDLRIISPQLMSWDWFVAMQAHNYPGVTFPGHKYHPRVPGAFSIKQFLDANIDRFHVFLCGPWKEGDSSYEAHYESMPYGQCDMVVRRGQRPANWDALLIRGWESVPTMNVLGVWHASKFTADTWEWVVYHDIWKRLVHLASYISFHSNQQADNRALADAARRAMDRIFSARMRRILTTYHYLTPQMYRDAGIVFGQWSKTVSTSHPSVADKYERKMLDMWQTFVQLGAPADTAQIESLVQQRVNPYRGTKIPL